jgi:hypothetical protein
VQRHHVAGRRRELRPRKLVADGRLGGVEAHAKIVRWVAIDLLEQRKRVALEYSRQRSLGSVARAAWFCASNARRLYSSAVMTVLCPLADQRAGVRRRSDRWVRPLVIPAVGSEPRGAHAAIEMTAITPNPMPPTVLWMRGYVQGRAKWLKTAIPTRPTSCTTTTS